MNEFNKTDYVLDQSVKLLTGLNKVLKETNCEHCKEVLRKIFSD